MKCSMKVIVLLLLMITFVPSNTWAENDVKIDLQLSKTEFHKIEEIDVLVAVINVSDKDMTKTVTLLDPSGKKIKEFGTPKLAIGESRTWSGKWTVTEKQLQNGTVTFSVKIGNRTISNVKVIEYTPDGIKITRTIEPASATKGEEVVITYTIVNNSGKTMKQVSIDEHNMISVEIPVLGEIATGETVSHSFKTKMTDDYLLSCGQISYQYGATIYHHRKDYIKIDSGKEETMNSFSYSNRDYDLVILLDGEEVTLTEEQKKQIIDLIL